MHPFELRGTCAARHELEGLKKEGELSEDDVEYWETELDKATQQQVAAIDDDWSGLRVVWRTKNRG